MGGREAVKAIREWVEVNDEDDDGLLCSFDDCYVINIEKLDDFLSSLTAEMDAEGTVEPKPFNYAEFRKTCEDSGIAQSLRDESWEDIKKCLGEEPMEPAAEKTCGTCGSWGVSDPRMFCRHSFKYCSLCETSMLDCSDCIAKNIDTSCCDGLYVIWAKNKSPTTAQAVLDFLIGLRKEEEGER